MSSVGMSEREARMAAIGNPLGGLVRCQLGTNQLFKIIPVHEPPATEFSTW